jgi:hypothetical protein
MVSHIPQFEIGCSYSPACQVLLFGCSLTTDAVNLIYEYHRTLAFLSCVVEQFPYQPATAEQCVMKWTLERVHPQLKVMNKIGSALWQWRCWTFRFSGLWHCVVGWVVLAFQRTAVPSSSGSSSPSRILLGLLDPEDKDIMVLNIGNHLPNNTMSHPRNRDL